MGKYENKTPASSRAQTQKKRQKKAGTQIVLVVVLSVFLAALLMMFVVPQMLYRLSGQESDPELDVAEDIAATEEATGTEETLPQIAYSQEDVLDFPAKLEDTKLEIESLFSFSGINPDSGNQECDDLATIMLKNTSEAYLEQAVIRATLLDGTECTFVVTDLPAGKSTMAFATGNESLAQEVSCVALSCEASFTELEPWDQLSVSTVGTTVTLQNNSGEDITNIDVYCRDVFGESYFGGITYKQTISNLPANQTATVDVTDSLLGMVEVVRIAINES